MVRQTLAGLASADGRDRCTMNAVSPAALACSRGQDAVDRLKGHFQDPTFWRDRAGFGCDVMGRSPKYRCLSAVYFLQNYRLLAVIS